MKYEEWIKYEQKRLLEEALRKLAEEYGVDEAVFRVLREEGEAKEEAREASLLD